jgi:transglutaminase-like putative cysteine protease
VIYQVRHRTTYAYESEVSFARCVLRLTPRSSATQTVMQTSLTVSPEPTLAFERLGSFGELTTTVVIETPHKALVIEAHARVDVHSPPSRLDFGAPWEGVGAQALRATDLGPEGPAGFLYPSTRAPLIPAITEYARASFRPGRGIVAAATELMGRMRRDFTYDAEATDVSTAPLKAFEARRGVCQDFAHIMICGLRGLGLPARYVSGFLRTYPPPGRPRLDGADATHAWVCLWCGDDTGWIGLDPTNDVLAQDDHIVLASGRDYADVAPIDGIILAPGKQTLEVEVDVIPESDLAPRRASGGR